MTNYDKMLTAVRNTGMDYKWAKMFVKKLSDDENIFSVSEEEKHWALKHGFYPGRVVLYGLTEKNYEQFMPDYQYFMLHPLNNHFLKWLDKTTLKYVLNSNGCQNTMPEYYAYMENDGSCTYLMNAPDHIAKDSDFLLNLLRYKGILAMKPNSGTSGGFGFIKLELKGDDILENNTPIDMERFVRIRDSLRNYIVTEYVYQHSALANIWADSECTLRVIMCKDPKDDMYAKSTWSCAVSYARFGTSISGGASNLSSGGIGIGFDFETAKYDDSCIRYKRFCENGKWMLDRHPDTNVAWKGMRLPNWSYAKGKIEDICQHISSLDYLGFDIIISEDGMKLCEINSHPAIDYVQVMCGATLAREGVRRFFEKKGLYSFDGNVLLKAYMESQE